MDELRDDQNPYIRDGVPIWTIFVDVQTELSRARTMFPWWPKDIVHAAAIMTEEANEVLKTANEVRWQQKGTIAEDLRKEIIQTMAMCVRLYQESLC